MPLPPLFWQLPDLSTTTEHIPPPTSRPHEPHQKESSMRNTRRRLTREPRYSSEQSMEIHDVSPAVLLARAREAQDYRSSERLTHVSETELLRDLIYIFQGINGQYIQYDPLNRSYGFISGVEISEPTKEIVFKLTDIGLYYMNIQTLINNVGSPNIGLIQQSLCATFQHNLADYYRFIAVLEAKIEKQMAAKDTIWTEDSLSLKRLLGWALQSQQELKLMDALATSCEGLKGGKLLTEIHNFTKHGDPFIKKYITMTLRSVSKPFYEMLERWIYEGELDDPFDEFFVACNSDAPQDQLWLYQYTLRDNMLPNFISKELAQKIFSIGKSLNFIRYSCQETSTSSEAATYFPNDKEKSFEYGNIQHLEKAIEVAYKDTSTALLTLLRNKYKLMDHLKALKRYMLLGQGDFIAYLINALWSHLNKPANLIYRHNLTSILESAIRSSDAQYDNPDLIRRLDVKLLEFQRDDIGWDVFTLEYHVDTPINTVLNPEAMKKYLQIFYYLWRLKRVECTLSLAWRQWFKARRDFQNLINIQQDIHSTQITIQYMVHFVYQLQHYILFEVLECSWNKLETFIENKSIDLDSVIAAHDDYLSEILEKGFLSSTKGEEFAPRLKTILECILNYKIVLDNLHNFATTISARVANDNSSNRVSMEKLRRIRDQQEKMEDDFRKQVLHFLRLLRAYHDEDLRSLATRLDYNDFYAGLAPNDHIVPTSNLLESYETGSFEMAI
ncbi:Spc98 family-domain-containing protein [Mycotypha africana]|uniref:Spc98 family-domain-containing protein n=1 Tax=Mycotypha africana TaxID=64632 RepID=UPI0023009807|nr:Spc98 family-domain-containing protein [Mycotypha africana]KAI8967046.1 Spc98 family-domain-containing protein [Mycotypha africana]